MKNFIQRIKFYFKPWLAFNVTLDHVIDENDCLWAEIQVVAQTKEEARESALSQLKRVNLELGSRFTIDKIWQLKNKGQLKDAHGNLLKPWNVNLKNANFSRNKKYLTEEFTYCKKINPYLSTN